MTSSSFGKVETPEYRFISVVREARLTIITIERPEVRNALHGPAQRELEQAFDAYRDNPDQWAAIITGSGERAFCAGHDLKQQAGGGGMQLPGSGFAGLTSRSDLAKPVIAAVNGLALGGGFETVLACDIVVAAEHAEFALPEARVGLAALGGGLHRLSRAIGVTRAMAMILTGSRIDAPQAYQMGLVNEVTSGATLMDAARRWAAAILACSPMSVRASKEALLHGLALTPQEAVAAQWALPSVRAMLASKDAEEGPRAFTERRPPRWQGR